ncbi:mechanosensitive ion channel [Streptosporangiaceae bacterium NEAU-GS5]|nr:mechanosensitive ion channel [Streptosporangiaceae bacterium NEAU-GS5]
MTVATWTVVAVVAVEVVRRVLRWRLIGERWALAGPLVRRCTWPGFATAAVGTAAVVYDPRLVAPATDRWLSRVFTILLIICVTWLVIQAAYAVTDVILDKLTRIEDTADHRVRRMRTQIGLIRRVSAAVVSIAALGAILFTFPEVRALGAGLLASAGIAGVVAGIAAQSTLGNLLAGLQLVFSDALRLDDVVVVQGEWGRIEELTLTYVALRTWDERRLILPVSYFTTNPFENWTRHGSRILGHVYLHVDWTVPVEEVRAELYQALRGNPLWDQKDWTLQVTDITPNGLVQLRATMSAADSASVWDLKCDMREHLVKFIREKYPESLPRFRMDLQDGGPESRPR